MIRTFPLSPGSVTLLQLANIETTNQLGGTTGNEYVFTAKIKAFLRDNDLIHLS